MYTNTISQRQEYDYYYYRRDHLGNNVVLWDATNDTTVQRTFYYASGLPMSCSTGQSIQSRKYTGKDYIFLQLSIKDCQRPTKTINSPFSCRIFA